MSTTNLEPMLLQDLVNLLIPYMSTEPERQAIVRLALPNAAYQRINFQGAADVFTVNMVNTLLKYGEDDQGKQTIIALLDVLYAQVGPNNQYKIAQIRQRLQVHFQHAGWVGCSHCGTANRSTAKYCVSCGKILVPPPLIPGGKPLPTPVFPVQHYLTSRFFIAIAGVVIIVALIWLISELITQTASPPAAPTATTAAGSPTTLANPGPAATSAAPPATPTPGNGSAPFVLFSGDPRSNNPPFCRGFQSQCNFDGCDAFVKLIEGPGCLQGEDARIVPGLYEVTLEGSGLVIAGRMTAADPLFPVPADGYNVTLSDSYSLCWRGWQASSEPFGIMAVTQTQLPNRVDQVTIRYMGSTCP